VALGTPIFPNWVFLATAFTNAKRSPNKMAVADRTAKIAKNQTTPFAKSEPVEHK